MKRSLNSDTVDLSTIQNNPDLQLEQVIEESPDLEPNEPIQQPIIDNPVEKER